MIASFFSWIRRHRRQSAVLGIVIVLILLIVFYAFELRPPSAFPPASVISVPQGQILNEIGQNLQQEHIVTSAFWFVNIVLAFGGEHRLVEGDYYFARPENVVDVAWRMTHGEYRTSQIKTTIPEGSTVIQIGLIIRKNYPSFDIVHFLTIAQGLEGYLFPNTYYFGAAPTPEDVMTTMTTTFNQELMAPYSLATAAVVGSSTVSTTSMGATTTATLAIALSGRSLASVITMASIVEREALTQKDRQIVAGILWKRLALGMPLDVDSTLYYVTGKTSAQLTQADLRLKSPYNTYTNKGLPPTPIGNPGLDAIMAAVMPIQTPYLYFLSDNKGAMHYAVTLAQHNANVAKYLN